MKCLTKIDRSVAQKLNAHIGVGPKDTVSLCIQALHSIGPAIEDTEEFAARPMLDNVAAALSYEIERLEVVQ